MSYGYLPYITLPSRITEYSATCIDHIFVKYAKNHMPQIAGTLSGMFYCDITRTRTRTRNCLFHKKVHVTVYFQQTSTHHMGTS